MSQKKKYNFEKHNDIKIVSLNEDCAVYRFSYPSTKDMTLKEKQKFQKQFNNVTVHYFDREDLDRLKEIEKRIISEEKIEFTRLKPKKSFFDYLYNFLEI